MSLDSTKLAVRLNDVVRWWDIPEKVWGDESVGVSKALQAMGVTGVQAKGGEGGPTVKSPRAPCGTVLSV